MESTRELSALNQRFSVYLQKIRSLAQINAELHREVEKAFRNFVGQNQSDKYLLLTQLREKITDEVRAQTSIHIRCQRAEYEREFFVNALKTLPAEQKNELKQMDDQLKVRRDELERLAAAMPAEGNRRSDEQRTLSRDLEEITRLDQTVRSGDLRTDGQRTSTLHVERENLLRTGVSSATARGIGATRSDSTGFNSTIPTERIRTDHRADQVEHFSFFFHRPIDSTCFFVFREDYREFNAIRQSELETLYRTKLDQLRQGFEEKKVAKPRDFLGALDSSKKEQRGLIEENLTLQSKLGKSLLFSSSSFDLRFSFRKIGKRSSRLDREKS